MAFTRNIVLASLIVALVDCSFASNLDIKKEMAELDREVNLPKLSIGDPGWAKIRERCEGLISKYPEMKEKLLRYIANTFQQQMSYLKANEVLEKLYFETKNGDLKEFCLREEIRNFVSQYEIDKDKKWLDKITEKSNSLLATGNVTADEKFLNEVYVLRMNKNYKKAVGICDKYLSENAAGEDESAKKLKSKVYYLKAEIKFDQDEYEECIKMLNESINLTPDSPNYPIKSSLKRKAEKKLNDKKEKQKNEGIERIMNDAVKRDIKNQIRETEKIQGSNVDNDSIEVIEIARDDKGVIGAVQGNYSSKDTKALYRFQYNIGAKKLQSLEKILDK